MPSGTLFKLKLALSLLSSGLFIAVAVNPRWIEELTGLEPDGGSGELEWVFAAVPAVVALALWTSTVRQYSRWRKTATDSGH